MEPEVSMMNRMFGFCADTVFAMPTKISASSAVAMFVSASVTSAAADAVRTARCT
jgi:hypothetical protein